MMVEINADKEEAEVVRVKVEAEEAMANEKVSYFQKCVFEKIVRPTCRYGPKSANPSRFSASKFLGPTFLKQASKSCLR